MLHVTPSFVHRNNIFEPEGTQVPRPKKGFGVKIKWVCFILAILLCIATTGPLTVISWVNTENLGADLLSQV